MTEADNIRLQHLLELRTEMNARFDALDKRVGGIEHGISGLLELTCYHNGRLTRQHAGLEELRERVRRLEELKA